MGGGSTGLRSAPFLSTFVAPSHRDPLPGAPALPFSFPPATRARFGCWRTINSKSELSLDNMVSGKPPGPLSKGAGIKRWNGQNRSTHLCDSTPGTELSENVEALIKAEMVLERSAQGTQSLDIRDGN
jgi:hypothetical protein